MKPLLLILIFSPALVFAQEFGSSSTRTTSNIKDISTSPETPDLSYSEKIYNFRKTDSLKDWKKAITCYKAAREARTSFGVDTGEIFESKSKPSYFYSVYDYAPLGGLSIERDGKKEKASPPTLFVFNEEGVSAYLLKLCADGTFHCARSYSVIAPGTIAGSNAVPDARAVSQSGSASSGSAGAGSRSAGLVCLRINHKLISHTGDTDPQKKPSDFQGIPGCGDKAEAALAKVEPEYSDKIPQSAYDMIYWRIVDQVKELKTELSPRLPKGENFNSTREPYAKQNRLTEAMLASCEGLKRASDPRLFSDKLEDVLGDARNKYLASIDKASAGSSGTPGSSGTSTDRYDRPLPKDKRGVN